MAKIPVFGGLGSDILFSNTTRNQALQDIRSPEAQLLAEACRKVFCEEVHLASSQTDAVAIIELNDFERPQDIIQPCQRYHHHPVVQHATLSLIQLLRYQSHGVASPRSITQTTVAVSGFCAGLFTAAAVATSQSPMQYLARAEQCFRAAVILGIVCEQARRKINLFRTRGPWSLVVGNIEAEDMLQLIAKYSASKSQRMPIYVSSLNTKTVVTISGEGDNLSEFARSELPEKCRVVPTNIFTLYHNSRLQEYKCQLSNEFEERQLAFPTQRDLVVPIISTIDGSLIRSSKGSSPTDLLSQILDMILIECTNWVSVEDTIVSFPHDGRSQDCGFLSVCNYGPSNGALTRANEVPEHVKVMDVSFESCTLQPSQENDIAVVGMALDLPGATDPEALWRNLMGGVNSCSEIPSDRFHLEDYYYDSENKPVSKGRSMGTRFGNFMNDPFSFDNEVFDISPREASSMDPQQRVMLTTVQRALENAGYVPDSTPSFAKETFGCFIGNATLDYVDNLRNDIDIYYSPGTLKAFLSGRISYAFRWSGPSITLDTACSSSLVAIHQAARALATGECRAAVAGGVNVISSPDMYLGLDRAHFLSPTGQCKAFDKAADGYCRSEGCAAVVLKRLSDAVNENDKILGVIKGVAVNQSGLASSITHPHAPTQEKLFKKVLSKTGMRHEDVSVVEAHGTGTPAGDPNEVRGIRNVFCKGRGLDNPLHIMSIKANIGHCEAASGVASLVKLLLMLKHKRIPPQPLLKELNPAIEDLAADGTIISRQPVEWRSRPGKRRTALLNNFGAAGSNAALLLQEHQNDTCKKQPRLGSATTHVFGCSARNTKLLEKLRESLISYFTANQDDLTLADVCYTTTARRSLHSFRLSTTASSIEALVTNLKDAQIVEAPDIPRGTVFLFSGQGSQYMGMGSKLMDLCPKFRSIVHRGHQLLLEWGLPSCLDVIEPDQNRAHQPQDPMILQALQTGVFVLEVALAQVLIDVGIRPVTVSGHSLGEYAALVTAGVLDFESGLWLVAQRARLIIGSCKLWETSMLAVDMSAAQVQKEFLCRNEFAGLSVACENSPGDCVVGGDKQKLFGLKEHISKDGRRSKMLNVPLAYHTAALTKVAKDFGHIASQVRLTAPSIPITSNVLGKVVQPGEQAFTPEYFSQHCCRTVAFDSGIEAILRQQNTMFHGRWIEIGPHPVLLPMVTSRLSNGTSEKLPTLRKGQDPSQTLSDIFCAVYRDNSDIQWRAVFENLPLTPKMTDLPSIPMLPKKYHNPASRELSSSLQDNHPVRSAGTQYDLLDKYVEPTGDATAEFHTPIQNLEDLIKGHVVCGKPLCPASVYTEMVLAAISHDEGADAEGEIFKLSHMSFTRPLLWSEDSAKVIRITIHRGDNTDNSRTFRISSFGNAGKLSEPKLHCFGSIKRQSMLKSCGKLKRTERVLARRKANFELGGHQMFSTATMYKKIFSRVVEYSPRYWAVRRLYVDDDAEEAFASCELPATTTRHNYAGHPILIDTMLHVAGFAANLNVDADKVCICHQISSTSMLRKTFRSRHEFDVHCSNYLVPPAAESIFADVHAVDSEGVIAVMKGVEFKRSKLSKIQAGFDTLAEDFPKASEKAHHIRQDDQRTMEEPRFVATKLALPVDDYEGSTAAESLVTSPANVVDILSKTTGVKAETLTSRTKLAALGVDSLMILELEKKLEYLLGHSPGVSELSMCESVGDVEALVNVASSADGSRSTGRSSSDATDRRISNIKQETVNQVDDKQDRNEPTVSNDMIGLLRSCFRLEDQPMRVRNGSESPESAPIYLVHPGAGMCFEYYRIGPLDRAVHAIQDPRMFSDAKDDWSCIEDMAEHYATIVLTSLPSPPSSGIILGGYSFGGVVAFEMARRLSERGDCAVRGVVLVDSPPPLNHIPLARDTIQVAMAVKHTHAAKKQPSEAARFHEAIGALAIRNNLRRAALLGQYRPRREGAMPRVVLLRSSEGFRVVGHALPENKWLHDRRDVKTSSDAWEQLVGAKIKVIDIPGDHFTPFEPGNIAETSQAIRQACEMLDE